MRPVTRQAQTLMALQQQQAGSALPPKAPGTARRCALRKARPCVQPGPVRLWTGPGLVIWPVSEVRRLQAQNLRAQQLWPTVLHSRSWPHGHYARAKAESPGHSAVRLQTYQHRGQQWPQLAHAPARVQQSNSLGLSEYSTGLSSASLRCCRQLPGADCA